MRIGVYGWERHERFYGNIKCSSCMIEEDDRVKLIDR